MTHELKILPEYFDAVCDGTKTFEIRKNDRGYRVGDLVILKEYTPQDGFTGEAIVRRITYITDYAQQDGYVVFSIV
jgi:ASC-1-like (ASCH) protein